VNAIPRDAMVEVDLRSISPGNMIDLESELRRAVAQATRTFGVESRIESMGERPSGTVAINSEIVQAATEVTQRFGVEPQVDVGSTDANIPISMGLPAIAIGGGGNSGNVHTPEEWFDPISRDKGIQRLLA